MVPNWLLIVVLVANVAVTLYLKPWVRVANWFASVRLMRQINAFRVAGLLLLLVTVAHAKECTTKEQQHVNCTPSCGFDKACVKRELSQNYVVWRDADYEAARGIAKANGVDVSAWDYPEYSRGNDKTLQAQTDYFGPFTTGNLSVDKVLGFLWRNAGALTVLALVCFLIVHFGSRSEHDATDVDYLHDSQERIVDGNYHGDEAFIVPDGMNSEYEPVPVRSRRAAAGR